MAIAVLEDIMSFFEALVRAENEKQLSTVGVLAAKAHVSKVVFTRTTY
jgi:hypothetical protein